MGTPVLQGLNVVEDKIYHHTMGSKSPFLEDLDVIKKNIYTGHLVIAGHLFPGPKLYVGLFP